MIDHHTISPMGVEQPYVQYIHTTINFTITAINIIFVGSAYGALYIKLVDS